MKINNKLKEYVEEKIFPLYENNYIGDEIDRIDADIEPRNIYGKILSSASRNSSIEQCLKRSYTYGKKKNPNLSDEEIFASAYDALLKKFGENGYAKFYFKDPVYEKFLEDIRDLLSDKDKFLTTQKNYINELKIKGEFE